MGALYSRPLKGDRGGEAGPRENGRASGGAGDGSLGVSRCLSCSALRCSDGTAEEIYAGKEPARKQRAPCWQGLQRKIRMVSPSASWHCTRLSRLRDRCALVKVAPPPLPVRGQRPARGTIRAANTGKGVRLGGKSHRRHPHPIRDETEEAGRRSEPRRERHHGRKRG